MTDMRLSLSAKTLGLLAAATLTLAACSSEAEPSSSESMAPTTSESPSHDAMAGDDAMSEDASADDAMGDVPAVLSFTSTTLAEGTAFDGASLAGKDTVLWFWAPWCPVCQGEAPDVAEAAAELPDGVELIGVPGQSDEDAMRAFTAEYGVEGFEHIVDADGTLWQNFDVFSQPAFAFINDDGTVETVAGAMGKQGILDAANELAAS